MSTSDAGLIPAHAGKIRLRMWRCFGVGAHPRSRGENRAAWSNPAARRGSSPLTRGKSRGAGLGRAGPGLIPAHAGKMANPSSISSLMWAHPRSRGENLAHQVQVLKAHGSSPLTRGKCRVPRRRILRERLIPAHAGKIASRWAEGSRRAAHPRSRGENVCVTCNRCPKLGSSPLTRGK